MQPTAAVTNCPEFRPDNTEAAKQPHQTRVTSFLGLESYKNVGLEMKWAGAVPSIGGRLKETEGATLTRRLCQVLTIGVQRELETIRQAELAEDRSQMIAHGRFADEQPVADLFVF